MALPLADADRLLREYLGPGSGVAVDLGGGSGRFSAVVSSLGYSYLNLDIRATNGCRAAVADAHHLPLRRESTSAFVLSDSLEHLRHPERALREVREALRPGGRVVVIVPFLHPFHGDDYFRFTPEGLRAIFADAALEIETLIAPAWVFTLIGQIMLAALRRAGLGWIGHGVLRFGRWLDRVTQRLQSARLAFAAAYLLVARRGPGGPATSRSHDLGAL